MAHKSLVFTLGVICLLAGCATAPEPTISPVGAHPASDRGTAHSADGQLQIARRLVAAGEYSAALPRLLTLTSEQAQSHAGIEAHFYLGQVYFQLGEYWEAQEQFKAYLAKAPGGAYVEKSQEFIDAMAATVENEYETPEELAEALATAQTDAGLAESDMARQLNLADLHWRSGHYDDAGRIYEFLLSRYPQLATDMIVRSRMERTPTGSYVVLTPQEVARRQAEAEPLLIFNTTTFRSGRDTIYGRAFKEIYYTVSGNVLNRSEQPLRNVQVTISIHGFGSTIYDVQTVQIGTLNPGDIRPFSVRFSNFDNIENVSRYETIGSYER
jgi:tetratricopeptide (TPR) repeat protein